MSQPSVRAARRPEQLREDAERGARAREARQLAERRSAELELELDALRARSGPLARLRMATVGSAAIREAAVAARALTRRPRRRGAGGQEPPFGAAKLASRNGLPPSSEERASERARRRVARLEWRTRAAGWSAARAGEAAGRAGGWVLARSRAAVAGTRNRVARRRAGGPRSAGAIVAFVHGGLGARPALRQLPTLAAGRAIEARALAHTVGGVRFGPELAEAIGGARDGLILICAEDEVPGADLIARMLAVLERDEGLAAVACASVGFELAAGSPVPVAPGAGGDGPALAGGCALLRGGALDPTEPCPGYRSDMWLIDLSVALAERGWRVASIPGPAAPGRLEQRDLALLHSRWGPLLRRRVREDMLRGGGEWCRRAARVASPDQPRVAEADIVVSPEDGGATARWLGSPGPGPPGLAAEAAKPFALGDRGPLQERLLAALAPASVCIQVGAPDWEAALRGGDYMLADALRDELTRRGHEVIICAGEEARRAPGSCMDVQLVLRGRLAGPAHPGQLRLTWLLSHPDEVRDDELERCDAVLVASRPYARELASRLRAPVHELLQFTDPGRFFPQADPAEAHELLFVGNWRGVFRRVVWDALPSGRDLALYGRGWDLMLPDLARAEHVGPERLRRLYSSCSILLADHWDDMRRLGFISNRIFDALACGAFVISDQLAALGDELPGGVETYRDADELREKVERYLADPAARQGVAARGRETVLAAHTVADRADQLLAVISGLRAGRPNSPA